MKSYIALGLAAMSVVALQVAAHAADKAPPMVVKAPTPPPPPPPPAPVAYNWSGCYVGGYGGAAWGDRATVTDLGNGSIPYNDGTGNTWTYRLGSQATGGGTLGCNYVVGSSMVIGVEAEAGYLKLTGNAPNPLSPALDLVSTTTIGKWDAIVAGRVGFAFDRVLVYAKGGGAFFKDNSTSIDTCNTGLCGPGLVNASGNKSQSTWVLGGGLEYAVGLNWTVKAEYLRIDRGGDYSACGNQSSPDGGGFGTSFCWNQHLRGIDTAKVGLNFKFN